MAPTDDLSQDLEQGPPSYFNVMEEGLPTYGEAVKEGALENPWKRLEGLMEEFDKLKCERSHIIEANEYMETFLTFKYCFIDGADNLLALNVVITLKLIFIMFVDLISDITFKYRSKRQDFEFFAKKYTSIPFVADEITRSFPIDPAPHLQLVCGGK